MRVLRLYLKKGASLEDAEQQVMAEGLNFLYSEEDLSDKILTVSYANEKDLPKWDWLKKMEAFFLEEVDWEKEWQEHIVLSEGRLHIALDSFGKPGKEFWLLPGPGFGNLTHPTTGIVLSLMPEDFEGADVVDLGTGSGILAFGALALGARFVLGIDIDPEAIGHAKKNSEHLLVNEKIYFATPDEVSQETYKKASWLLLNMISSEQEAALKPLLVFPKNILVSGVLQEEKEMYLAKARDRGWLSIREVKRDGWLGWHFIRQEEAV